MSRKVGVLLTLLALAGVAVFAGVTVAWDPGADDVGQDEAGAAASPTVSAEDIRAAEKSAAAASAAATPDPMSGQIVATDEPVVVDTREAPVAITFYGWDPETQQAQAGGYVAGVVENGGTCTLTLTKGGATAVGTSEAQADASTTVCGAVVVPGDQLSSGTWQAVLTYRSAQHVGTSGPVEVEVIR